jgi:hypothetical protein
LLKIRKDKRTEFRVNMTCLKDNVAQMRKTTVIAYESGNGEYKSLALKFGNERRASDLIHVVKQKER